MKYKLRDTYLAYSGAPLSNFFKREVSKRWYGLIAMQILDMDNSKKVPNNFYLLVCSQECLEKPFRKMPSPDRSYTLILDDLSNTVKIREAIEERLSHVTALDKKTFESQMSKYFYKLK